MTSVLHARQTAARHVLARIAELNGAGEFPAGSVAMGRRYTTRGRDYRYRVINGLITRGLVEDLGGSRGTKQLRVTDAGLREIESWTED